jgi:hypothetical protein
MPRRRLASLPSRIPQSEYLTIDGRQLIYQAGPLKPITTVVDIRCAICSAACTIIVYHDTMPVPPQEPFPIAEYRPGIFGASVHINDKTAAAADKQQQQIHLTSLSTRPFLLHFLAASAGS